MKKPVPIAFIFLLLCMPCMNAFEIFGELTNPSKNNQIFHKLSAVILIRELGKMTIVNKDGSFLFEDVPGGKYTLVVIIPKLQEQPLTISVPGEGKLKIEVPLKAIPLEITEVKKKVPIGITTMQEDLLAIGDDPSRNEKRDPYPALKDGGPPGGGVNIGALVMGLLDLLMNKDKKRK